METDRQTGRQRGSGGRERGGEGRGGRRGRGRERQIDREIDRQRHRERERGREEEGGGGALFFTNLSLMTKHSNNSIQSNKNTNNRGKLKYILRTKQKDNYCLKLRNIQNQQSNDNCKSQ